ncbi:MAG: AMP-binding protein, partial [Coxiellaceae bacterium]|nr:AMP-binding protein [Coxiellaceae bacterium]
LGLDIYEAYGQTENTAFATIGKPGENTMTSVGKARAGVDVKIADNGEILIKSPGDMVGYYKDEELTKTVFTDDGYLKTGDMGRFDDNGFLYIIGRVKEQFKTAKGEYITPVRIENEFSKNTDIEQCCLVGAGLRQPVLLVMLSETKKQKGEQHLTKSLAEQLDRINPGLSTHEKVSHIIVVNDTWTPENGLMTATLKLRRKEIEHHYKNLIEATQTVSDPIMWESHTLGQGSQQQQAA